MLVGSLCHRFRRLGLRGACAGGSVGFGGGWGSEVGGAFQVACFSGDSGAVGEVTHVDLGGRSVAIPREGWVEESTGIMVLDVEVGEGPLPELGEHVHVRTKCFLEDWRVVEEADLRYLHLTSQRVIGFEAAVDGMRQGGLRWAKVPPELGYGWRGVGNIPPNATLYYLIHLLAVNAEAVGKTPTFWDTAAPATRRN